MHYFLMRTLKQQLCHFVLVFILLLSEASAGVNFDTYIGSETALKSEMNSAMITTEPMAATGMGMGMGMGNCVQCLDLPEITCTNSASADCDSNTCSSGQCNNLIENPSFQTRHTRSDDSLKFKTIIYKDYYVSLIPRPPLLSL